MMQCSVVDCVDPAVGMLVSLPPPGIESLPPSSRFPRHISSPAVRFAVEIGAMKIARLEADDG